MPIYEYFCHACHHAFDARQKITDEPIKTCPKCGKDEAEKQVSAAGFQLKGTGWYVTDFRDKSKKTTEETSSKKETKSSGSAD